MGAKILRINKERFKSRMDCINNIAVTDEGGMMRLALSNADKIARDQLREWMHEAGMQVFIDDLGCMYGYSIGSDSDSLPICSGSHLDTQPNGGKFDGLYGVMAALEVVCTLNDYNIQTKSPIAVINWTNEEGARFIPPMQGSGVAAGIFEADWVYKIRDQDGNSFLNELEKIGYIGEEKNRLRQAKAYIEAHIEQGPILDKEGYRLGVVDGALGIIGLEVGIFGEANHAGSTPMKMRKDSLMIAAKALSKIEAYILDYGSPAVGTVGTISVSPSSRVVIPGETHFLIDIRYHTQKGLMDLRKGVESIIKNECTESGVECKIEKYWHTDPVHFNGNIIEAITKAAVQMKLPYRTITSGAGHDAVYMNSIIPTGMIFVPSIGGKSHCPDENTRWEDLITGVEVLLGTILHIDEQGDWN